MPVNVQVGDWCGVESGRADANGVEWTISKLEGWWDAPDARLDLTDRPQQHGSFDARSWADARVVVIEGRIKAPGEQYLPALQAARHRTQALLVEAEALGRLRIRENGQDLTALVRRSDKTTCDPVGAFAYDFSVQLTAPDPVRYETEERRYDAPIFTDPAGGLHFPLSFPLHFSSGTGNDGRLVMPNPGTASVWPTFRIDGPTSGDAQQMPVLTAPNGDRLVYRDPLAAGEFLVIDTRRKQVLLQGVSSRRYRMQTAQFEGFRIPPGSEGVAVFSTTDYPNPDSRATARWSPGYW